MEHAQGNQRQLLVSVVIPAHNEEKWIAACLESVLKDVYPHKEVIVIDDASTDRTNEILRRFAVAVVRNEKPMGPSSARNIGLSKAKGEIIVFIDAHCIIEDQKWIQKFLQFFKDTQVGAVAGYFRPKSNRKPTLTFKSLKPQQRLVKSANAAFRKTVLEQVGGFDKGTEWGGDAALTYKIQKSGWKIIHTRDITVTHAEKLWSIRRAFTYGTCYFPLLRRYPHETLTRSRPIAIGLLLILGIILDLLYRPPVFTVSFMLLLVMLNGATHNTSIPRIFIEGLYNTIWALSYFLGAIYGLPKHAITRQH